MNILTSEARFRQRVIKYSLKDGYKRSYTSLVRVVNKWVKPAIKEKQTKKPKPYKRAEYPGQKVK